MINDISFCYIDNFGNQKKYIIIDKFHKNNKNYIIYKEEEKDDIYSSLYEVIDNQLKIIPIKDDKDYDIVDQYLESL